jgi:hypothetical protein
MWPGIPCVGSWQESRHFAAYSPWMETPTKSAAKRPVPRPFKFEWGGGNIIEEASFSGEYVEPAIQLLEYGEASGEYGIRFCYYSHEGRFQRSPMMIDSGQALEGLRVALKTTPKLRELLRRLVM